jgi:hypothetical protein
MPTDLRLFWWQRPFRPSVVSYEDAGVSDRGFVRLG